MSPHKLQFQEFFSSIFQHPLKAKDLLAPNFSEFGLNDELYASISIPGYATPGLYTINVAEVNGAFSMNLPNSFTVNNAYTYAIQGNVRYDGNGNGCDAADIPVPYQRINFVNGGTTGSLIANSTGFYSTFSISVSVFSIF